MLFHRWGLLWLGSAIVTFGGSGGMMTRVNNMSLPIIKENTSVSIWTCGYKYGTARKELPYPCSPQVKTRGESSRRGK